VVKEGMAKKANWKEMCECCVREESIILKEQCGELNNG